MRLAGGTQFVFSGSCLLWKTCARYRLQMRQTFLTPRKPRFRPEGDHQEEEVTCLEQESLFTLPSMRKPRDFDTEITVSADSLA